MSYLPWAMARVQGALKPSSLTRASSAGHPSCRVAGWQGGCVPATGCVAAPTGSTKWVLPLASQPCGHPALRSGLANTQWAPHHAGPRMFLSSLASNLCYTPVTPAAAAQGGRVSRWQGGRVLQGGPKTWPSGTPPHHVLYPSPQAATHRLACTALVRAPYQPAQPSSKTTNAHRHTDTPSIRTLTGTRQAVHTDTQVLLSSPSSPSAAPKRPPTAVPTAARGAFTQLLHPLPVTPTPQAVNAGGPQAATHRVAQSGQEALHPTCAPSVRHTQHTNAHRRTDTPSSARRHPKQCSAPQAVHPQPPGPHPPCCRRQPGGPLRWRPQGPGPPAPRAAPVWARRLGPQ